MEIIQFIYEHWFLTLIFIIVARLKIIKEK